MNSDFKIISKKVVGFKKYNEEKKSFFRSSQERAQINDAEISETHNCILVAYEFKHDTP